VPIFIKIYMAELYISLQEPRYWRNSWIEAARRLGVEVVDNLSTPSVLPLTNMSAAKLALQNDINFMSADTHDILIDCYNRQLHLPAVPAAQSYEEVQRLDMPVYVKPRANLGKGTHPLAHSRWASGVALCNSKHWRDFVDADPQLNGLVVCPDLGTPMSCLDVDISINSFSEVYVINCYSYGFISYKRPFDILHPTETIPTSLVAKVQEFCYSNNIRGGIYNIQVVEYNEQWCIMDWNIRPSSICSIIAQVPGVVDKGLAHMLSLPLPEHANKYLEVRSYWDPPIAGENLNKITSAGLFHNSVWNDGPNIRRVIGVGHDRDEVEYKFNILNKSITN
jgi:hypothetical protein